MGAGAALEVAVGSEAPAEAVVPTLPAAVGGGCVGACSDTGLAAAGRATLGLVLVLVGQEGWWQTAEVVDLAGLAVAAAPAGKLVVGLVGNGEW